MVYNQLWRQVADDVKCVIKEVMSDLDNPVIHIAGEPLKAAQAAVSAARPDKKEVDLSADMQEFLADVQDGWEASWKAGWEAGWKGERCDESPGGAWTVAHEVAQETRAARPQGESRRA
jgi:hypothetical protein